MNKLRKIILVLLLISMPLAAENQQGPRLHPWHNIFSNLGDSYWGWNSLWHVGAFGATYAIAQSGADNSVQRYFWKDPIGRDFGRVGLFLGWFWQITPAAAMYLIGLKQSDNDLIGAGSATIQAIATTGFVTMVLKYVSGRQAPLRDGDANSQSNFTRTDNATDFRFFNTNFTQGEGRFFWPSGHTSSTIAFASALYAYYPEKHWIAVVGYSASLAMGLAVLENDSHWFSDVVAGAMIGHVIGWTTGKNFRRDMSGGSTGSTTQDAARDRIRYSQTSVIPRQNGAYLAAVFQF